jgi:hypothetical protein
MANNHLRLLTAKSKNTRSKESERNIIEWYTASQFINGKNINAPHPAPKRSAKYNLLVAERLIEKRYTIKKPMMINGAMTIEYPTSNGVIDSSTFVK